MSDASDDKIMGLVPKNKYVYFAYTFLLVSAAGNALYALVGMVGIELASAVPAITLLGLLSVILAAVGLTKHKNDFTALDHAHFKYIAGMFLAFLILNIVLGGAYTISYFVGYFFTMASGVLQTILVWTGYNSWQGGRIITKDNIKSEVQTAIKNR